MSLKPVDLTSIPEETARVAKAAFPKGNIYLKLRDELGALYQDELFSGLFPERGCRAMSPGRLALTGRISAPFVQKERSAVVGNRRAPYTGWRSSTSTS